jgi:hypothetical protein
LLQLTQFDRINREQILNLAIGNISNLDPEINWEACRALSRFEPNAVTPTASETGYVLGVPLAIASQGGINGNIANAIAVEIGQESVEGVTNVTLWDKLAGQLHANYMYSIVPLIDKALVVPFVPGLSSGDALTMVHRVLQTSDYESIDLQAIIPRPLRAVGITMAHVDQAGGSMQLTQHAQYASFGGVFDKYTPGQDPDLDPGEAATVPDARYKEGLFMFKAGPKWMSGFFSAHLYTQGSTAANGPSIRSAITPMGGTPPGGLTQRQILKFARPVWDYYARTVYIHEVLKNRQGTITGPVRFDIAPGSSIKIEATEDKFVKHVVFADIQNDDECDQKYIKYYWCSVLRVSTMIDCQNMRAFTNFYVAHTRTRDENKDVATAIGRHPVWQKCRWAGCVLWEDPAFGEAATKDCEE